VTGFFDFFLEWGAWIAVPLALEGVLGALRVAFALLWSLRPAPRPRRRPLVTVIVPCRNSEATLEGCLESVAAQTYLARGGRIEVLVADNGSADGSHEAFRRAAARLSGAPGLALRWLSVPTAGKAKALNAGISAASGEIVATVDSDGRLHPEAVERMAARFQAGSPAAVGGGVLIDWRLVERKPSFRRLLQVCEAWEYMESFLVGRVFGGAAGWVYTLAGAFSGFRRDALLRTRLYHQKSIVEDTWLTFEIKRVGRVVFEPRAVMYTDTIEGLRRLYLQRFRWHRGQMEIAFAFKGEHLRSYFGLFRSHAARVLFMDHTLLFSRTVWLFMTVLLYFWGYPLRVLAAANLLIYALYAALDAAHLPAFLLALPDREYGRFALRCWWAPFLMPAYRFLTYALRLCAVVDGVVKEPRWAARPLDDELREAAADAGARLARAAAAVRRLSPAGRRKGGR